MASTVIYLLRGKFKDTQIIVNLAETKTKKEAESYKRAFEESGKWIELEIKNETIKDFKNSR